MPKKMGRPTHYRPEFCDQLWEHMKAGKSFESFAGLIEKNLDTLYEWVKKHPDFAETKKKGTQASLLYWEQLGIAAVTHGMVKDENGIPMPIKFNTAVWIFVMKNRFGWADKVEVDQKLSQEKPSEVKIVWQVIDNGKKPENYLDQPPEKSPS